MAAFHILEHIKCELDKYFGQNSVNKENFLNMGELNDSKSYGFYQDIIKNIVGIHLRKESTAMDFIQQDSQIKDLGDISIFLFFSTN